MKSRPTLNKELNISWITVFINKMKKIGKMDDRIINPWWEILISCSSLRQGDSIIKASYYSPTKISRLIKNKVVFKKIKYSKNCNRRNH